MIARLLSIPVLLFVIGSTTAAEIDQDLVDSIAKKMTEQGAELMPITKSTPQFLRLAGTKEFNDSALTELKPLAEHILWLDLAESQVTDQGLTDLETFKNLTRLNLEKTSVSDASVDSISRLQKLEYLNLYQTQITDKTLLKLSANNKLEKLFIWKTQTSGKAISQLAKALPDLEINAGWRKSTEVKVALTPQPKSPTGGSSLNSALAELTAAVEEAKLKTESAKMAHSRAMKKAALAAKYANTLELEAEQMAATEKKTVTALEELKKAIQAAGLNE